MKRSRAMDCSDPAVNFVHEPLARRTAEGAIARFDCASEQFHSWLPQSVSEQDAEWLACPRAATHRVRHSPSGGCRSSHALGVQLAADQHAPDLARAGADLVELGVAPEAA